MKNKKYIFLWILTLLYTLFIWSNSLAQGEESGNLSLQITNDLLPIVEKTGFTIDFDLFHHYVRKLAHFSEYFLLAFLVYTSSRYAKPASRFTPLLFWILVPCIDESIQHFVPDRYGAISDVILDMSGYLTGYVLTYILFLIIDDLKGKLKTAK